MIVDTSALVAILRDEPEREEFARLLLSTSARISAANWLVATMVADGSGDNGAGDRLDRIVETAGLAIEPVTETHARAARIAFRRYGRGSGSPARLNFGDCFAYALSATSGEPLLFKGVDFTHTDVLSAR
ncbi:type II toxin-antitoxin system VapC family toxin [Pimelobacter simplex]|uniref:type II toxin-antitoxin system VapC family toxin n=1 Tax=Nocardioides simplex TaxID=2045 RepID=UPI00214FF6D6|nr:type II toxin-antitoxin system VapC family toxin [Pimelobacter simplex]UUW90649.1 type II toxin-antitoxin system VapC family toxin [Pimelobacter simplex]UUW94478.1 type II toxin-antitoxin system VapC family toxin [Pimelobacter simplex]